MPLKTCHCGKIIQPGGQCPDHPRKRGPRKRSPSSEATSRPGWKKVRLAVLERDGYTCTCGAKATEVDHIVPASQGGSDDLSNLRGMCLKCNRAKAARRAMPHGWT
jgi:5-methylcytosine-specific restriction protein A